MHFYCDKPKYSKKWIFLFHRKTTVYWQRHKSISTQFSQKKTKKKSFFQNNNFILWPNILFHIFSTFYQKKKITIR